MWVGEKQIQGRQISVKSSQRERIQGRGKFHKDVYYISKIKTDTKS